MTSFAFFGPALGRHEGWVTTQGEVLAGLLAERGHSALVSSTHIHPMARAGAHARDLLRWRGAVDLAVVSVFSGRAFTLSSESILLARSLRIPVVAWLHGGGLPTFATEHPRWVRRTLRAADAVVAPSPFLARWAAHLGVPARVIPNVLDLDAYRFRERDPVQARLLWMRTFLDAYDPSTAVRTLAELRARGIDATLTMAGQDKGLLQPTRDLVHRLELDDHVRFPGFVPGPDKADLFDRHDIFLNTNLVDNAPVTVLEAAASGLVVVSSDAGGVPDLLSDGVSARLVPAGSVEATADAVCDLLTDPGAARAMCTAARSVAARSDWPPVRDAWLDLAAGFSRPSRGG